MKEEADGGEGAGRAQRQERWLYRNDMIIASGTQVF